jgi:hypothetical protein
MDKDPKVSNYTEQQKRLVICPVRKVGETKINNLICLVTIDKDSQGEYNLTSVFNKVTSEELLPIMDTFSKQMTLQNILTGARRYNGTEEPDHIRDLRNSQGNETIESIFKREED